MDAGRVVSGDWRILHSDLLCESPWLRVERRTVATPSRPEGTEWIVAVRPVAAVVAPRTREGAYLLIRQERLPVMREMWEFPAGQCDAADVEATAHRELAEEARAGTEQPLVALGVLFSSVGFTDECCHLFLARDVRPLREAPDRDAHEAIHEVRAFSTEELRAAVADGRIQDSNTLAIFARLSARGLLDA